MSERRFNEAEQRRPKPPKPPKPSRKPVELAIDVEPNGDPYPLTAGPQAGMWAVPFFCMAYVSDEDFRRWKGVKVRAFGHPGTGRAAE